MGAVLVGGRRMPRSSLRMPLSSAVAAACLLAAVGFTVCYVLDKDDAWPIKTAAVIGFGGGLVGIVGWRQSRARESTLGALISAVTVLVGVVVVFVVLAESSIQTGPSVP